MHAVFDGLKVPRNSISDSLTTYWISINDSVMSWDLIAVTPCHGLSHGIVHHADLRVILFHGMSKLEVRQDPQSLGGGKILFAASALGVWLWSQEGSGESSRWRMLFERDRVGVFLFLMTMSHSHRRFQIFFCRLMRVQMCDLPSFATSIGHVVFLQSDHRVCAYWIEIGHWYQPEEVHLYWRWPRSHCFQNTTLQYCFEKSHISVGGTTAQYSIRVGCFNETAKSMNLQSPAVNH